MTLRPGEWTTVRRLAAQQTDRWDAIGTEIWCAAHGVDGRPIPAKMIGTMRTAALAQYVVHIHNAFLPMMRRMYMALRRAKDVQKMEQEDG